MNSEMDLMILNKVKGIQGTVDNIGQKVDEGNDNVSQKLDNLQVDVDLSPLNSTLSTGAHMTLDEMIASKILLYGVNGETFHLYNKQLNIVFDVSMDSETPIGNSGWRELLVHVPLGEWEITATIPSIGSDTRVLSVESIGNTYVLSYYICSNTPITEICNDTTYTLSDNIESIVVYACGGGGGGGGGIGHYYGAAWGAGGSGAACIKTSAPVIRNKELSVVIGKGGTGGGISSNNPLNGNSGTPTVLSGVISLTLPGGGGGTGGSASSNGQYGTTSTTSGGIGGGTGAYYNGSEYIQATSGLFGAGGSGKAGGGGSYGAGGNTNTSSGNTTTTGGAGGYGAGGAGGYGKSGGSGGTNKNGAGTGGKGGDGYVIIYKGVSV